MLSSLNVEIWKDFHFGGVPSDIIRWTLEGSGALEPRRSALEDDFEEEEEKEEEEAAAGTVEPVVHERVSCSRSHQLQRSSLFLNVQIRCNDWMMVRRAHEGEF